MSDYDIVQRLRDTNHDIYEAWPEGTTAKLRKLKEEIAEAVAQQISADRASQNDQLQPVPQTQLDELKEQFLVWRKVTGEMFQELWDDLGGRKQRGNATPHAPAGAAKDSAEEPAPSVGRFTGRADHASLKPPEWLIEGLIPENADVAIYAPFGALKTFAVLDMAMAVATGCKALGQFAVRESGPVYFFAGEGYHSLVTKRTTAWEIEHGLKPFGAPGIRVADGVPITTDDNLVEADIAAIEQELDGGTAKLVIIDTMNRALNGQDEDKSHVAARYLQTLTGSAAQP